MCVIQRKILLQRPKALKSKPYTLTPPKADFRGIQSAETGEYVHVFGDGERERECVYYNMVRFKNRYIIARALFHDKKPTSEHALSNQLKMEIESAFGVSGSREMCPSVQVKYYEQKYGSNVVVLRCSRKDCQKVKLCLENIERVEGRTCTIRAVAVHGKLGSLKENVLEKIGRFAVNGEDGDDEKEEKEEKRRKVRRKVEKAVEAMTS